MAAAEEMVAAVAAARPVVAMVAKAVATAAVLTVVAMVAVTVVVAAAVAARPSLASSRVKARAIHRAVSLQASQETPTHRPRASKIASRATMTSTTSSQPATPLPASLLPANPPAATATTSVAALAPAAARVALLAGATGLVGRAVLARLPAGKPGNQYSSDYADYSAVHCVGRRAPAQQHPRLVVHLVDSFNDFTAPPVDDVFIALGTTIKVAGSREAFRAVDLDAVLAVARAGRAAGATRLAVVSAMGADSQSAVYYNRVKGEMEDAVRQLGFQTVVIARPSLLSGDRASLKQAPRLGEQWALRAAKWLNPLIPANYRAVDAGQVANALVDTLQSAGAGQHLLLSGEIRQYPRISII
jgi:uncharacterized protein YbjT (DUF2867 family)